MRAETAPYKYPRRVWFVDELPKTTSGKIHRAGVGRPACAVMISVVTRTFACWTEIIPTT